ncbi:hypothetical protein [Streptomyces sp. NPDC093600]|uniref:hypothetical protein n=1 Tax=Streptomyces sp. NPDC093600 TaxID=3366047 RepID=UPI00380B232B
MTDFQSMSHQKMLEWLDEASSFYVREAADRLAAAAVKMDEIAEQVKVRPGRVNWQGEAEKAFMEWAAGLASSTRSLSDYSENAAARMRDVAVAIAAAQSAIPRYTSHADAKENLAAAQKYRNDPDSATVARNARSSMAEDGADAKAIAAKEEANRQAAAREMERLSSSYKESGQLMERFPAPTFPPPPGDFVPDDSGLRAGSDRMTRSTGDESSTVADARTTTTRSQETRSTTEVGVVPPSDDKTGPVHVVRPEVPVDLGIDSVGTLPPPTTTTPPATPPSLGRPDTGLTPPLVVPPTIGTPPVSGGRGVVPPTSSRAPLSQLGRTGPGQIGPLGMPRDGISGGRPVPPASGRSATGIPRSPVIGTEHGTGTGRTPMGPGMGGGPMGGPGGGQNGISGGRRLAVETGGVVGGRPQQPGAVSARPFTPGGSGLVRGGTPSGAGTGTGPVGRGGGVAGGAHGVGSRREDSNGERPDYLVEDEETWQQGGRRVAPPVID